MAISDLTITAANVAPAAGLISSNISFVTYGTTVTQGDVLYSDASDSNHHKLANCGASATAQVAGIALTAGVDGDPGIIVTEGPMDIGATVTEGRGYVLSNADGNIMLESDLASGNEIVGVGIGLPGSQLYVRITQTGATKT